jgi:hypothetical protein
MDERTSTAQAYRRWLDGEIARHEQRRVELRSAMRFERSAESECYRTGFGEARVAFLRLVNVGGSDDR